LTLALRKFREKPQRCPSAFCAKASLPADANAVNSRATLEGKRGMKGGILGSVIHSLTEPDEPKPQQITEEEFDALVWQLRTYAAAKIVVPENHGTPQ